MADREYTLTFNLNFNASGDRRTGQSLTALPAEKVMFNSMNYIMNDIAFFATQKQQKALQGNLNRYFETIVRAELSAMAEKIASLAIGLPDSSSGPTGVLRIEGPKSELMTSRGATSPILIRRYTDKWSPRTPKYVARRRATGNADWYKDTGELQRAIRQASLYTSSFGNVAVTFSPSKNPSPRAASRVSDIVSGGRSKSISVGTLRVSVLGRITTSMLADPDSRSFDSRYNGLFDMLPDDIALKLGGKQAEFRPIIEPFLSYYLTRQIPNRVFYTLEQSVVNPTTGHRGFGRQL